MTLPVTTAPAPATETATPPAEKPRTSDAKAQPEEKSQPGGRAQPEGKSQPGESKKAEKKHGARIVHFRVARKPKCAEGTAVFRADPVPLVIEWEITGATGGALSVDDPTGTPGTYGPVELKGSQEFLFSCAGEVGSTETHTYDLYTAGDGPRRSARITASATVLDKGIGTN